MKFQVDDIRALRAALESMCSALEAQSVPENAVFDCKLVANELLINALRHGGGHALFTAETQADEVVIRVRSGSDFRPPEKPACSGVDTGTGAEDGPTSSLIWSSSISILSRFSCHTAFSCAAMAWAVYRSTVHADRASVFPRLMQPASSIAALAAIKMIFAFFMYCHLPFKATIPANRSQGNILFTDSLALFTHSPWRGALITTTL